MWFIYTMGYYPAMKNMKFATVWIKVEVMKLISHKEK
jgi:hypothetical protein